mgnify:CR=1 FL=1
MKKRIVALVLAVLGALRAELAAHLVACVGVVVGVKIAVGNVAADVVHGRCHGGLHARVVGCGVDGKASKAADAEYSDAFRVNVRARRKVVYGTPFSAQLGRIVKLANPRAERPRNSRRVTPFLVFSFMVIQNILD